MTADLLRAIKTLCFEWSKLTSFEAQALKWQLLSVCKIASRQDYFRRTKNLSPKNHTILWPTPFAVFFHMKRCGRCFVPINLV